MSSGAKFLQRSFNVPAPHHHGSCDLLLIIHSSTTTRRPEAPPPLAMWSGVLLEDLEGDGGVLDGHDHAAVVQVQDVMLLFKNLKIGPDVCGSRRGQRRTGCHLPVSSSAHSRSSCTCPPYIPPASSPDSLKDSRVHVMRTGWDGNTRTDVGTDVRPDVGTDVGTHCWRQEMLCD